MGVTSVSLAAAVSLVTLHTKVEGSMQDPTAMRTSWGTLFSLVTQLTMVEVSMQDSTAMSTSVGTPLSLPMQLKQMVEGFI